MICTWLQALANSFFLQGTVYIENMEEIIALVSCTLLSAPEQRPVSVCFYLSALKHQLMLIPAHS